MFGKLRLEHPAVIAGLLLLAVVAVYLPAAFLEFTNYDDPYYVTDNPPVMAGLTWGGIRWAFRDVHTGNWHPVTYVSHMLDCHLFGTQATGHHLSNLFFHCTNTVVLFLLLRSLTGRTWPSALVAALFGLHPLHVESVAWVSERKDVLSTFFGLLCLVAYGRYARAGTAPTPGDSPPSAPHPLASLPPRITHHASFYYYLALTLFALGLMSKPMLVTWPCLMLVLDYWPLERWNLQRKYGVTTTWPLIREKLPFFALSAVSSVITFFAQRSERAVAPLDEISLGTRVINAVVAYLAYLGKMVWPTKLAVIYPYVRTWPWGEVLVATIALSLITLLALSQHRRRPYLLAGWAWYVGTLVPVIGFVQVGNQAMADRYTYIPAIGIFLMAVWTAAGFVGTEPRHRALVALTTLTVLAGCALVTQTQLAYWQTSETLFRHALAVTKDNYIAHNSLGFFYADQRQLKDAESSFRAALAIYPRSEWALNKLGSLLIDQDRLAEATRACESALAANPRMTEAHVTLGLALLKQGRTNEAIAHYEEAIRLRPQNATAHYNLANTLAQRGQFATAREHYQAALRADPASADVHNNFAYILAREGNTDAAVSEFRAALARQPRLWPAHYGLGEALLRQGKRAEAATEFAQVVKLQPKFSAARVQLGLALVAQERLEEAVEVFSEALRLAPNDVVARHHLATIFARQGKAQEAIQNYREVLSAQPEAVNTLDRLAWLLATHSDPGVRDGTQAIELAEHACRITAHQKPGPLLTLAAARAEAGRFPEAISAAEQAQRLATGAGDAVLTAESEGLLTLFRSGRPYHQP